MATAVEEVVVVHSGGCGCGGKKRKCNCNQEPQPDFVEEDDKDEDPFVDIYGRHEMTNKEYRIYSQQVRQSGGFQVDKFSDSIMLGGIQPVDLKSRENDLKLYTEMAIEDYNKNQNANLEFLRIVKANRQVVRGSRYYITFLAKNSSGESRNYQALVWDGIWEKEVEFCRPEPIKQGDPKKSRLDDSHGV